MPATRLLIALAILALTTCALSAHDGTQLAQAGTESSPPPATPAPSPTPAQTAAPEQKLVGLAAWNKLVGNSISGTEDGKPLIEYYAPDGAAKSMLGNEISTGTWMLVGEVICFKYADDDKPECYSSKSPAIRPRCMTKKERGPAIKSSREIPKACKKRFAPPRRVLLRT